MADGDGLIIPLLIITLAVLLTSIAFGGGNVFECADSDDCTFAAIRDIADFQLDDLLDIPQVPFIVLGDVLDLITFSFIGGLAEIIGLVLTFVLFLGWLWEITRLAASIAAAF